jgi:signal transduction histidine kinase/ABC-type uncharacterized transport system substrate-binding protein
MPRVWLHFIVVFVLSAHIFGTTDEAQPKLPRLLIFNEVGTTYPGIELIDQGIRAALNKSPYKVEVYREYMDTILFPDPADQERFREFYIRKYEHRRPDVIITVGPSPLKFMVETHTTAFPGVPIIFCYPNWVPGSPTLDSDFTGVENDFAAFETVGTALRLRPGTRNITVVGGRSFHDMQLESMIKEQLRPYEANFSISYQTTLTMPELLDRLKKLPEQTIVLYTSFTQDAAGSRFTAPESSAMVAGAANAPVFSLADTTVGHGEVGGKVSSLREQGKIAGGLALRILDGEKPQDIPRVKAGTTYMFDWRALKRWGMREANLPPRSIVLNRQPTFWESYRRYVIGGISLILFEALLILGLIWQRARRRRAENELVIAYDRVRIAVDAGQFVGWEWDIKAGTNRWFGDLQGMFGIPSESYFAQRGEFLSRVHPADRDRVSKAIDDARKDRQPYKAEFRIPRDNSSVRWVIARGKYYYDSSGDAVRMLGMAVDITERKQAEEALSNIGRQLIEAQEEERRWIARELHDDINQRLALLAVNLSTLKEHLPALDGRTSHGLDAAFASVLDLGKDVQALSHRLHSSKLEYLGLVTASRSFCSEFSEQNRVEVGFHSEQVPKDLPNETALCLFRILQEALQNAKKYSGSNEFQVSLRGDADHIELIVSDSGVGFDPQSAASERGLGLTSMKERIKFVDGHLSIESKPQQGTTIRAWAPLRSGVKSNRVVA